MIYVRLKDLQDFFNNQGNPVTLNDIMMQTSWQFYGIP